MKKIIAICSLILAGCYNQTPAKIIKHPSLYGVPVVVDTKWDGNYPVQNWMFKARFGEEFTDFQGRVFKIEKDPYDTNSFIFTTKVL